METEIYDRREELNRLIEESQKLREASVKKTFNTDRQNIKFFQLGLSTLNIYPLSMKCYDQRVTACRLFVCEVQVLRLSKLSGL